VTGPIDNAIPAASTRSILSPFGSETVPPEMYLGSNTLARKRRKLPLCIDAGGAVSYGWHEMGGVS
jgi:hypothetical protein